MNYFTTFLKKELIEYIKNYKLLIMIALFSFFGFLSPITAKYTPDILNAFLPDNMQLTLQDSTWIDSWQQFFKNISQIGLIVIIALFIGMMNREYQNGTLINLITKGVSRTSIVLAKYVAAIALFTASFIVCTIITILYTYIYFDLWMTNQIAIAIISMYLFYCFLLALLLFVSTICKKETNAILFLLLILLPNLVIMMIPDAVYYHPLTLLLNSMSMINQQLLLKDILPSICITIMLIITLLTGSVMLFKRKEL